MNYICNFNNNKNFFNLIYMFFIFPTVSYNLSLFTSAFKHASIINQVQY